MVNSDRYAQGVGRRSLSPDPTPVGPVSLDAKILLIFPSKGVCDGGRGALSPSVGVLSLTSLKRYFSVVL